MPTARPSSSPSHHHASCCQCACSLPAFCTPLNPHCRKIAIPFQMPRPRAPSFNHYPSADFVQYELMSPSPLSCGSTFIAGGVTGGGAVGGGGGMSCAMPGGLAAMSSGGGGNTIAGGGGVTSSAAAGGLAAPSCGGGGSMAGAGGGTIAGAGANASASASGQSTSAHQLGSCNGVTHDRWAKGRGHAQRSSDNGVRLRRVKLCAPGIFSLVERRCEVRGAGKPVNQSPKSSRNQAPG
jgi:hypothetical protein